MIDIEKAEEQEIKLPTSLDHRKTREFQKNICFMDYTKAFDCVSQQTRKVPEIKIPDYLTCFLRDLYAEQEATVRTGRGKIS